MILACPKCKQPVAFSEGERLIACDRVFTPFRKPDQTITVEGYMRTTVDADGVMILYPMHVVE